jgi:hypothetical protein
MNELTRQLTDLKQLLDPLRLVIGSAGSLDRTQELVAGLEGEMTLLDRNMREKVAAGPQVEKLTDAVDPAADRLEALFTLSRRMWPRASRGRWAGRAGPPDRTPWSSCAPSRTRARR